MTKKTYGDKLKDPRWQKKRLEILQRDEFTCQKCHSTEKTLHVHHKAYVYGKEPWEYMDVSLITYCWDCHEAEEANKVQFKDIEHDLLLMGFDYQTLTDHLLKLITPMT